VKRWMARFWKRRGPAEPGDRNEALRLMRQLRRQSTAMGKAASHSGQGSIDDDLRHTINGPGAPF
jgi:hypothetical protein